MKTPVSYYGGKQQMVKEILPLIPKHTQYVELFFGGGSVFFAKPRSEHEVINDLNLQVINFYKVLKTDFDKLNKLIQATLHSEYDYQKSMDILKAPLENKIEYAWAFWCQTTLCFSNIIYGGFAFGNDERCARTTYNKKLNFDERYLRRIEKAEIFNRDALELIKLKDSPDTFFYIDPPYVSSNCGHYDGYTMDDFKNLLDALSNIKGKFLLSSYPEDILMEYRSKFGWHLRDIEKQVNVTGKREGSKMKTECLTYNYIPDAEPTLFDV